MKFDASKLNVAIPAALIPFAVPFATIAAEGTGRVSLFVYLDTSILLLLMMKYAIHASLRLSESTTDG